MKERQSNIELLRIVAMFLVLMVHADFFSLGAVTPQEIRLSPLDAILRVFFEAISINCVNIFVLISGWFGLHASFKGGFKFLFQCFFFLFLIYVVSLLLGVSKINTESIKDLCVANNWNWFIKAYLLLYILSPVLNAFAENSSRYQFLTVLLSFYAFQFVYGWIFTSATEFICEGYSISSLIGLYLLARFVNIYGTEIKNLSMLRCLLICLGICCIVTFLYVVPSFYNIDVTFLGGHFLSYISPSTIVCSLLMLLAFSKIQLQSKKINFIAKSSFAVYLLHLNLNLVLYYKELFITLHNYFSVVVFWIVAFMTMFIIFMLAVILDQIRIKLYLKVCRLYDKVSK